MGWSFKNIGKFAKNVVKNVKGIVKNPVVANIASFIPGGSALVNSVSFATNLVQDAVPEVAVQKKAIAAVVPPIAVSVPGVPGVWKTTYQNDTEKMENV